MRSNDGYMSGNRMRTTPIPVQRTTRNQQHRVLTSMPAGKMVPLCAIPLLREDSLALGSFRLGFDMGETVEVLMNAVNVRVMAYLVSNLALDRFDGMDAINKSYEGIPVVEGGAVIPWFETGAAPANDGSNAVLTYMGKHAEPGTLINTHYLEAYNQIWNYRAKNRSKDIPLRARLDATLAPAFWDHQTWSHVVPDFDQAVIDGEVALNVVNSKMPVGGLGLVASANTAPVNMVDSALGTQQTVEGWAIQDVAGGSVVGRNSLGVKATAKDSGIPDVWAELQDNGITVSLSNIEMARKTQAFAQLRKQYYGHSDEYIIDLLMDGISLPDQVWQAPMLLADQRTVFGMSKRYASDGASLTESVVNGATFIDVNFSVPKVNAGGVVLIVAEISPEQLFERQKDTFMHCKTVDDLPQFLRDTLDPEKVQIVQNSEVDIDHTKPNDTFGYAPMNWQWAKSMPQVGGKFLRPQVDADFDEDRQRIWAVETVDPVLSKDFYLCTTMHYKPFVVTDLEVDPFEVLLRGQTSIRGNTVFGGLLVEATNDYDKVMAEAPTQRIEKDVVIPGDAATTPAKK